MSDPIAVSILAKLTSWYTFDGTLNDARGLNNLGTSGSSVVSGYAAGKKGQMITKGSRSAGLLASPFNLTTNNAITLGGWVYYDGTAGAQSLFVLSYDFNSSNSAFGVAVNTDGSIRANGFPGRSALYGTQTPGFTVKTYNFNVKVTDSLNQVAISPQSVNIDGNAITNGFYFVVAKFEGQVISIYVNGQFRVQSTPPMPSPITTDTIKYFQIGQQFGGSNTNCGLDEVFMCQNAVMTDDEIMWLYNSGNGRSYAEVVALAA